MKRRFRVLAKTLSEIQTVLNTQDFDFDTLKAIAAKRGFQLEHYVTSTSFYVLK